MTQPELVRRRAELEGILAVLAAHTLDEVCAELGEISYLLNRTRAFGECRHCGQEIVQSCDPPSLPGLCRGWKHTAWLDQMPIGAHYCGGRSVNPLAEPAEPPTLSGGPQRPPVRPAG